MGIVFRQSIKTTIVIALGALLGAGINVTYTHLLVNRNLGFINNIIAACAMLQILVQLGTGSILQVFIQKYSKDDERRRVLFTFSLVVPVVIIAILCVPFFLFQSKIISLYNPADWPNLLTFYKLVPITVFLWSYMTIFDIFLMSQSKTALANFIREVVLRLCNFALILLFYFKFVSFTFFVTGLLLMYGVPAFIMFLITLRLEERLISFKHRAFSRKEYKELFHFGWYHLFLFASLYLIGNIDLLMLGIKDARGMETGAVYRIAVFLVTLVLIPNAALGAATWPMINKAYIKKDSNELRSLFKRSAINILLLTLCTATLLFCNLHNVVMFLGKDKGYEQLVPIFSILIIGRLIDVATGLNNEVISISMYYKFSFRVSTLLVALVFIFDYLLIPRYSVYGAAWGTTTAFAIFNLLKMLYLWRKLKLQPFTQHSLMLVVAIIPALVAGRFTPFMVNKYIDIIVRSSEIILIYAAMLLWLKPSPDLITYIASVKKDKRLF
jgi:O-antigen/teichoic acid export membrane protein